MLKLQNYVNWTNLWCGHYYKIDEKNYIWFAVIGIKWKQIYNPKFEEFYKDILIQDLELHSKCQELIIDGMSIIIDKPLLKVIKWLNENWYPTHSSCAWYSANSFDNFIATQKLTNQYRSEFRNWKRTYLLNPDVHLHGGYPYIAFKKTEKTLQFCNIISKKYKNIQFNNRKQLSFIDIQCIPLLERKFPISFICWDIKDLKMKECLKLNIKDSDDFINSIKEYIKELSWIDFRNDDEKFSIWPSIFWIDSDLFQWNVPSSINIIKPSENLKKTWKKINLSNPKENNKLGSKIIDFVNEKIDWKKKDLKKWFDHNF